MKNFIRAALALCLLAISPVWATIALGTAGCVSTGGSGNPQTVAFGSNVPAGDIITVYVGNDYNSYSSVTVSDAGNGTYTSIYPYKWTGAYANGWWYVKASVTATPTVSVANPSADYITISACDFTGFTGTPTIDATIENHFTAASTTAVSASPITSNFNNELLLFGFTGGSDDNWTTTPPNWTVQAGSNAGAAEQITAVEATSGTTNNISGTLTTSQTWYATVVGIYDAAGSSCTHDGITSAGALAIPNGTSGSYQGKSGAFVTPNCSSVNYKEPTVGNFGVN